MVSLDYRDFTGFLGLALLDRGVIQLQRPALILAAGLSVLALGACNETVRVTAEKGASEPVPKTEARTDTSVIRVISSLQCPQTIGSLTRKGPLAENGRRCTYTGPRGTEINLHLVSTEEREFPAILQDFETRLQARMPEAVAAIAEHRRQTSATAEARTDASANSSASTSTKSGADDQKAQVRLPGIRINADGDNASVRIGGLHIDANDGGADININGSGESVSIQAADRAAEVRSRQTGEALRATWTLTSEDASATSGLRRVGYEARGPLSGPIVVATFQARSDSDDDSLDRDVHDLVVLNVGG